jgi:hypothetical protein
MPVRMGRRPSRIARATSGLYDGGTMASFDTRLPDELAVLHRLELPCVDGEVIDFEPFDAFWPGGSKSSGCERWTSVMASGGIAAEAPNVASFCLVSPGILPVLRARSGPDT